MSPDIKEATDLLKTEKIWNAVKNYMEQYHAKQVSNLKYSKEAQLTYTQSYYHKSFISTIVSVLSLEHGNKSF